MKTRFVLPLLACCSLLASGALGSEDFLLEQETSISLEILESLERLREHPLDINSATFDELLLIPYLSPVHCLRIIDYRERHSFSRIDDLLHIAGISEYLLEKMAPFVTVGKKGFPLHRDEIGFRSILGGSLPGDTCYAGNSLSLSSKLHYSKGRFFAGATAFKDPYEKHYADFYALYAGVKREDLTCIAGDYAMDIGERLISGYPGFVFKSGGMVKGREALAKPYVSGFEDFAYRGAVIRKQWQPFDVALFLSMNRLDGTFEGDTAKRVIYQTGYHRTEAEREKKNRIEERVAAVTSAVGNEKFSVRSTFFGGWYDRHIEPDPSHYYRFSGKDYALSSIHFRYAGARISLWSEYACSHTTRGTALIIGMRAKPHGSSITMLYRDYSETYYSPRAFAFCETEVRNERGLYSFASFSLPLRIRCSGYLDIFSRPFPTFHNTFPVSGYEAFLSLEKKTKGATFYLRYKHKEKNNYQWLDESLDALRQTLRCSIKVPFNAPCTIRMILQGVRFSVPEIQKEEWGSLISCSFSSRFLPNATAETGFAFFDTDSYDSRLYLFVNDIPGILHTSVSYGRGFNGYVLAKVKLGSDLRFYGKCEIEKKTATERRYRFGVEWR